MIFTNNSKLIFSIFLLSLFFAACGGEASTSKTTAVKTKQSATSQKTTTNVVISGKNVTTTSGSEFCLDVQVSNFVDVISMQYSTNWDAKMLEYKGVKNFSLKDLNKQSFGRAQTEPSTLRLSWYPLDLQGVTLFDNKTIYQVCFKAIGESGSTTQVEFANEPMVAEIANSKMKKLGVDLKSVQVTIQ